METAVTILHADLDAFYASVEQLLDPGLRGRPIAVGGGVVLAASYEARAFGVRGGMPGRKARELCPELVSVGGHFKEYQRLGDATIGQLAHAPTICSANQHCRDLDQSFTASPRGDDIENRFQHCGDILSDHFDVFIEQRRQGIPIETAKRRIVSLARSIDAATNAIHLQARSWSSQTCRAAG